MQEIQFLEDIAKPYNVSPIGDVRTWELLNPKYDFPLPSLIYVIDSEMSQNFLLGREKSGREKFNMIRYLAQSTIPLFIEQLKKKNLSQYLFLKDSYPFDLQYAFGCSSIYKNILVPTSFVVLKHDTFRDEYDQILIGHYCGDTWLIPIPVLSKGLMITHFLKKAFIKHYPKQVYLFTICGSLEGLSPIYRECKKNNVDLIPIFFQCLFKNAHPPFSVFNSGSITTKDFFRKASNRFQGKQMCCIGSLEESLYDPVTYSINTLYEMMTLSMDFSKEDWDSWSIDVKEESFQKKIFEFNPTLFEYLKKFARNELSNNLSPTEKQSD